MINLLPPLEKQNLSAEEQRKIIFILGLTVMIFFTSLILILISVNFSVTSSLKGQNIILANKENEFEKAEIQEIKQKITKANQSLSELDYFYKQKIKMSGFFERISALLPEEIYLKNITVNPLGSDKNTFQIALFGRALSIDDIIELNEKLKADNQFSHISFPPTTWLQKQNFIFDVTFQAILGK